MLVWGDRSMWSRKAWRGKLTLLRVFRASRAARRAGSALAKSSSQSLCFPLTTTAMAATFLSSSSAITFSLDTFSVSIPTTWEQHTFILQLFDHFLQSKTPDLEQKKIHITISRQFGKLAKLKLVPSRSNMAFVFGSMHKTEKTKLNVTMHMPKAPSGMFSGNISACEGSFLV